MNRPAAHPDPGSRGAPRPPLRIAFILLPRFTLTSFAGFVDAIRLAADDGDRSFPLRCAWSVVGEPGTYVTSSCGVPVGVTHALQDPRAFDYVAVVGGLLHGGQKVPPAAEDYLRRAAAAGVRLIGLCTGSFALARAGLMDGYLACVSWFHREDYLREFPGARVVSDQLYVVDRDRLTCAGGTSVIHLAGYLIEHEVDRATSVKALRILGERQPLPPRALQPERALSEVGRDSLVRKAMMQLEQNLAAPVCITELAEQLQISRRQLVRRFGRDIGMSPSAYRERLRMERSRWLLQNTDLQVAEIAQECGFQDSSNFSQFVRRNFGCSPRQLRERREPGRPAETTAMRMPLD